MSYTPGGARRSAHLSHLVLESQVDRPLTGVFIIGPLGPCPPWAVDDGPKGGPSSVDKKCSKSKVSHTAIQSCLLELINARKVKTWLYREVFDLTIFVWHYSTSLALENIFWLYLQLNIAVRYSIS